jgi:hypothetical protein
VAAIERNMTFLVASTQRAALTSITGDAMTDRLKPGQPLDFDVNHGSGCSQWYGCTGVIGPRFRCRLSPRRRMATGQLLPATTSCSQAILRWM